MSRVRPFAPGDIAQVAALRRRSFAFSAHADDVALAAYIADIFFDGPWNARESPSLVFESDEGQIAGFLGVIERPATFFGQPIRIAVCTQFMVDSAHRGLAGVQLVRKLFEGDQDLTFADAANDASRCLWERLGGTVAAVNSLTWIQPIRPTRFRAAEAARGVAGRGAAWVLRPLFELIDSVRAHWPQPAGLTAVPLTPEMVTLRLPEIMHSTALLPAYTATSIRWLFEQLDLKREQGDARRIAVIDHRGMIAGWFIYLANRGGTGEVVQVVADDRSYSDVLSALFHDAKTQGLTALEGRASFAIAATLEPESARIQRSGPWALVQSKRSEILKAITSGDALLSRLEGEWWMNF